MAINILGAIVVCMVYWALWYGVGVLRRKLKPVKGWGLKALWTFSGALLFLSGACFVAAALVGGNVQIPPAGQAVSVLVFMILLGTIGFVSVKRTAKAKAAEVQAASIPAGKLHGWTVEGANGPTPIEAFSDRFVTPRADSIIDEIKGMRI